MNVAEVVGLLARQPVAGQHIPVDVTGEAGLHRAAGLLGPDPGAIGRRQGFRTGDHVLGRRERRPEQCLSSDLGDVAYIDPVDRAHRHRELPAAQVVAEDLVVLEEVDRREQHRFGAAGGDQLTDVQFRRVARKHQLEHLPLQPRRIGLGGDVHADEHDPGAGRLAGPNEVLRVRDLVVRVRRDVERGPDSGQCAAQRRLVAEVADDLLTSAPKPPDRRARTSTRTVAPCSRRASRTAPPTVPVAPTTRTGESRSITVMDMDQFYGRQRGAAIGSRY